MRQSLKDRKKKKRICDTVLFSSLNPRKRKNRKWRIKIKKIRTEEREKLLPNARK